MTPLPIVVLISGGGSNLQALIDAAQAGTLPVAIRAVISNRADAFGLTRAARAGVPAQTLSHRDFASRADYDVALAALVERAVPELVAPATSGLVEPATSGLDKRKASGLVELATSGLDERKASGLVVLAGFMRILTPAFVSRLHGRLLNIHPSLLPKYPGLHTHARALAAGDSEHGATVHFVTDELDGGPAIIQARVPVLPGDDADRLAARVLVQEHRIYPQAVRWFAEGRLHLGGDGRVVLDDRPLQGPVCLDAARPDDGPPDDRPA